MWDPTHRLAAETAALASNQRRHLRVVAPADPEPPAAPAGRIDLGAGDYDIAVPDLTLYEGGRS